jgi:nicotinate-nucleotide pyrophosphorylase (carboxylating)
VLKLNKNFVRNICKKALNEDLYPSGDITSALIDRKIKKRLN